MSYDALRAIMNRFAVFAACNNVRRNNMKHSRIAAALCLLLAVVTAAGCASGGADTTAAQITEATETAEAATTAEEVTEPESVTTEETPEDPGELVIWQPGEKRCAFSVVYDKKSDEDVTAAADMLAAKGLSVEVVDMHTIKPLDNDLVLDCARTIGKIVTCEEHSVIGGLGSAVCELTSRMCPVPVSRLGVNDVFGKSGDVPGLFEEYGLTAAHIVKKVNSLLA